MMISLKNVCFVCVWEKRLHVAHVHFLTHLGGSRKSFYDCSISWLQQYWRVGVVRTRSSNDERLEERELTGRRRLVGWLVVDVDSYSIVVVAVVNGGTDIKTNQSKSTAKSSVRSTSRWISDQSVRRRGGKETILYGSCHFATLS